MSVVAESIESIVYQVFSANNREQLPDLEKNFVDEVVYLIDNSPADIAVGTLVRIKEVLKKNASRYAGTYVHSYINGLLGSVNAGLKIASII